MLILDHLGNEITLISYVLLAFILKSQTQQPNHIYPCIDNYVLPIAKYYVLSYMTTSLIDLYGLTSSICHSHSSILEDQYKVTN